MPLPAETPDDDQFTERSCNLAGGGTVYFDALDRFRTDHDETWQLFDLFERTIGG